MSTLKEPTFFAGRRMNCYFKGGRLMKDKKTDQRFWRFKWAVTLQPADARACGGAIESTYQHIQARENAVEKVEIGGCVGGVVCQVFPHLEADGVIIRLDRCFIDKFAMTYADGMTEFWIQLEHDLTDQLHDFVKVYAFQRFWVEFLPKQRSFTEVRTENPADPDNPLHRDGISTSISSGGKTLAEFKPKGSKPN